MTSEVNGDECQCVCHTMKNVMHVSPCCSTCPYCKRNRMTYEHMMNCPRRPKDAFKFRPL